MNRQDLRIQFYGSEDARVYDSDELHLMEEYANLRLSEQKEKHEKEMEEFAEWCEYECWYYVGQSIWTKRISGDIRKVIEKATTTELLTKFKNR